MSALPERSEQRQTRECYRDELNFAEFPLASVSTSLPKDQKTLEFTDEIFDKSTNQRVTRKLTITASDKYGLPTAMDDEVTLGLIQLTGKTDFAERRVFFTRYELLKLLNWTDDTRNYHRLEESLNRWLGVTLYYDKSWWSKEEQSWVNEGFILDQVTILDKERQRRGAKKGIQTGKSSFVWNEVVFNSFKSGYLKQIDWDFFKQLESAISKRMYRFLDKRFYQRPRLEFELRTFACEHIGLAKKYHNGELKRVLSPAIAELEAQGFLKKLPFEERFVRRAKREWTAIFVREGKQITRLLEEDPELVKALIERGVNRSSARMLVAGKAEEKIREKIARFIGFPFGRTRGFSEVRQDFSTGRLLKTSHFRKTTSPPQLLQNRTLECGMLCLYRGIRQGRGRRRREPRTAGRLINSGTPSARLSKLESSKNSWQARRRFFESHTWTASRRGDCCFKPSVRR